MRAEAHCFLNSLSGRPALNQCCISKCRVGAPQSVNNGVCQNNYIGKCIFRCHQVTGNPSKKDSLKKINPTTCCSVRELQTAKLSIGLLTNSSGTAQSREWNFTALQGSAAGLYPIFLRHGALQAWQSRDSLQPASSSAAVPGQNIPAGESNPARGQSRRGATLPTPQVTNCETEHLNNVPKATMRG